MSKPANPCFTPETTTIMHPESSHVNLAQPMGFLNPRLHCSGVMPNISWRNIRDGSDAFAALNLTASRTHDQALANPGQRVVDTHFIFPNMHDDPANPANYYFDATDHLFEITQAGGVKILYRMGTSIEHTKDRHFNANMPEDFEKYAEVLAGIVRHYTQGWANGFEWGIDYWEIWNEADLGELMWNGTMEDYYRFYVIVAKRLKAEFPGIKVGGPALCGMNEQTMRPFLAFCRDHAAPLDFFSWHCYTSDVNALVEQPSAVRLLLDQYGFTKTETMLNEWHYLLSWDGLHRNATPENHARAHAGPAGMFGIDSAAFNVSAIARWHDTPLDSAWYYGCGLSSWDLVDFHHALNKNYHSLYLVGQMMKRFPRRFEAHSAIKTVSLLAGGDDDGRVGILIADYRGDSMDLALEIQGVSLPGSVTLIRLDHHSDCVEDTPTLCGTRIVLQKREPGSVVFLLTFESGQRAIL